MSEVKFIPPQQSPWLVHFFQSVFYLVVYFVFKIRLSVSDTDVAKVKAIADERVVYLPNHSNLDDGLVVFLLSARVGQMFHYVVAFEAFRGLLGRLMQRVGAYSIRRGMGDRQSIVQTLKILQQEKCKLVVFPEGGCSYQNDTTIPFRSGAIELSFRAMEKLVKQEGRVPNFYLVPVSLKYTYDGTAEPKIDRALSRLEKALALEDASGDRYLRLRAIGERIIINLEREYAVISAKADGWNLRIDNLRERMLNYCEASLNLKPLEHLPNRERIYRVQSSLNSLTEAELPETKQKFVHWTTVRLLNFDAIYDGYIREKPTPERFLATIDRLEREVFRIDRPISKGQQKVKVSIGNPINLKAYWQEYQSQTKGNSEQPTSLIERVTQTVQQTVQSNL